MPLSRSNPRRSSKYSHHIHSNYRDSKYNHKYRRVRSRDYDKKGNISENFNYYTKGYSRHSIQDLIEKEEIQKKKNTTKKI